MLKEKRKNAGTDDFFYPNLSGIHPPKSLTASMATVYVIKNHSKECTPMRPANTGTKVIIEMKPVPSNHQGKRSHKHTPSEKSGLVAETLQAARMQQLRLLNEEGGDKTEKPEYEIEYD